MDYSLTIFRSIFDNKTHRRMDFSSWSGFENLLFGLSKEPGYKPKRGERVLNASPLITPAIFTPGQTRSNAATLAWAGWAAMDVDDYDGSFAEAMQAFNGIQYVVYSSASSRPEKTKFRMIFPLTEHVQQDSIRHFWYALNKEFNSLGDPQTKDLSRMYYVPAKYPDANNFIDANHRGSVIDPGELIRKHDFVSGSNRGDITSNLTPEMSAKLMEYRMTQLQNRDVTWTSFQDCPFVNRKQLSQYASMSGIDGSGRYAKMYGIMVSIASSAMRKGYPITSSQIATLCREIDANYGSIYKNRPFETEAERAIVFAFQHN
jgi:hypothetical protein